MGFSCTCLYNSLLKQFLLFFPFPAPGWVIPTTTFHLKRKVVDRKKVVVWSVGYNKSGARRLWFYSEPFWEHNEGEGQEPCPLTGVPRTQCQQEEVTSFRSKGDQELAYIKHLPNASLLLTGSMDPQNLWDRAFDSCVTVGETEAERDWVAQLGSGSQHQSPVLVLRSELFHCKARPATRNRASFADGLNLLSTCYAPSSVLVV